MLPYDERGTGPAVVLVHAGIADRRMWSQAPSLLEALAADGYRAVAVDLPGFGDAAPTPGPQAPWNDLLATLDDLGIEGAALVGASYGGAVALRAAALHRGRFWALVLVSAPAPGLEPSEALITRWVAEEQALERGDLDGAARAVADAWTLPGADVTATDGVATWERVRDYVFDAQRRAFDQQAAAAGPGDAPDPLADPEQLTSIAVPTLVTYGEHDLVDFREGARLIARLLPEAQLEEIRGAAHLAPLEQPERFTALLHGVLAAHRPA